MLRELDVAEAMRTTNASNPITALVALHKARYYCTDISDKLRLESAEWLREHGHPDLAGMKILPRGQLPK